MADSKNIVTLGIGASPGKLLWFITSGLEADVVIEIDVSVTIDIVVPPDKYLMFVPEEGVGGTGIDRYYNAIVPPDENLMVISDALIGGTGVDVYYKIIVPPGDFLMNVEEET